jgi:ribA/ribD-fused uncharacterized protein
MGQQKHPLDEPTSRAQPSQEAATRRPVALGLARVPLALASALSLQTPNLERQTTMELSAPALVIFIELNEDTNFNKTTIGPRYIETLTILLVPAHYGQRTNTLCMAVTSKRATPKPEQPVSHLANPLHYTQYPAPTNSPRNKPESTTHTKNNHRSARAHAPTPTPRALSIKPAPPLVHVPNVRHKALSVKLLPPLIHAPNPPATETFKNKTQVPSMALTLQLSTAIFFTNQDTSLHEINDNRPGCHNKSQQAHKDPLIMNDVYATVAMEVQDKLPTGPSAYTTPMTSMLTTFNPHTARRNHTLLPQPAVNYTQTYILPALGSLLTTATYSMLFCTIRTLHLQTSKTYTGALFGNFVTPLIKTVGVLHAVTSPVFLRELSAYLTLRCLPGGFAAVIINNFAGLPLCLSLPQHLIPNPAASFTLGALGFLCYPLPKTEPQPRRFGRVQNGYRQGFLQKQHAADKAERRLLNTWASKPMQHTYAILQSTVALLLKWPYVLVAPPMILEAPNPGIHRQPNNTCAARAVALATILLSTPTQALHNHAFLAHALDASDFPSALNNYPTPPLQGENIQVPLNWFNTEVCALSTTTGSSLHAALLEPPSNILILTANGHAHVLLRLEDCTFHLFDPSPAPRYASQLSMTAWPITTTQLTSALAITPNSKIEIIALGPPTPMPLNDPWSREATLTSILRGPPTVLFSFKDPKYSALSNLSLHNIVINGHTFRSVEHYFQSRKHLPINPQHARSITLAPDAFKAKALGGQRTTIGITPKWETIKIDTMRKAVRAKFSQHPVLRDLLTSTADATLIEATNDNFWGRGFNGHGQNIMGTILMEIRASLTTHGPHAHIPPLPPHTAPSPLSRSATPPTHPAKRHQPEPKKPPPPMINIHPQGSLRHPSVAPFSCAPLAISLASLFALHPNNDFTLLSSTPLTTNLLNQARQATTDLTLPATGSFILDHLLMAPELHLAGAWPCGPPPLLNHGDETTTTELFLFSHRANLATCGHTVLLCRSRANKITNYAYFDATYTDTHAVTLLPNSSWPATLASLTQNCKNPLVEIIAITPFKPTNASLGGAALDIVPTMPVGWDREMPLPPEVEENTAPPPPPSARRDPPT